MRVFTRDSQPSSLINLFAPLIVGFLMKVSAFNLTLIIFLCSCLQRLETQRLREILERCNFCAVPGIPPGMNG